MTGAWGSGSKARRATLAAGLFGLALLGWGFAGAPGLAPRPAPPPAPLRAAVALDPQPIPVEVVQVEFGRFRKGDGDAIVFEPTLEVPAEPGEAYGWRAVVKTEKSAVRWREELTLPEAPRTWGEGDAAPPQRSDDGRTAITEQESAPVDGVISDIWTVAEGDPKGRYELKLSIEGGEPKSFSFEVK